MERQVDTFDVDHLWKEIHVMSLLPVFVPVTQPESTVPPGVGSGVLVLRGEARGPGPTTSTDSQGGLDTSHSGVVQDFLTPWRICEPPGPDTSTSTSSSRGRVTPTTSFCPLFQDFWFFCVVISVNCRSRLGDCVITPCVFVLVSTKKSLVRRTTQPVVATTSYLKE